VEKTEQFIMPSTTPSDVFQEHINRYIFASQFVNNKRILDIACGIGYGSTTLIQMGKAEEIIGADLGKRCDKLC
jgi:2-polyprenyl-3-methyl-5-hydroxy-6-metoxy-1,4-benzoquinol methylase